METHWVTRLYVRCRCRRYRVLEVGGGGTGCWRKRYRVLGARLVSE